MSQISPRTLGFLTHLAVHNSKVWMDEWRDFYHEAKQDFIDFAQALLLELQKNNPDFHDVDIKQCMFRINRDMRFSKDKTPYKPWFSAYLAPGGKKSQYAGLYIHIEPGKSMIAGGCYELDRDNLTQMRQYLIKHYPELNSLTTDKHFVQQFGQLHGSMRTVLPRGYTDIDAQAKPWLMQDSRYTHKSYTDDQVISPNFITQIVSDYRILKPINDRFNEAIDRQTPLERTKGA